MNQIMKNIAGGIVIIIAAALIGVVHNAVRGQSIPLVQKVEKVQTARHDGGGDPAEAGQLPDGAVTVDAVKALVDDGDVYVIDARAVEVFEEGHIPGAINIPYDRLPEYFQYLTDTVPLDARIVCYCRSLTCDFSDQLATELKIIGYTDISVFTGGWEEWQSAGHPEETGAGQ
jgi:rhodanese-related sulfurtransferase